VALICRDKARDHPAVPAEKPGARQRQPNRLPFCYKVRRLWANHFEKRAFSYKTAPVCKTEAAAGRLPQFHLAQRTPVV